MHKFTVLIVEDEKSISDFIFKILSSHDYRVKCASTGKEALSLASSLCPDIILLDMGLPDIDGMEVIQQIRLWSGCPIIVISARTQEDDKVRALDAGADDYLTKPFGTSELLARIRTSPAPLPGERIRNRLFQTKYYGRWTIYPPYAHRI